MRVEKHSKHKNQFEGQRYRHHKQRMLEYTTSRTCLTALGAHNEGLGAAMTMLIENVTSHKKDAVLKSTLTTPSSATTREESRQQS